MMAGARHERRAPKLWEAFLPVVCLVVMLFFSVRFFGADSSYGANQIALLIAAGIASLLGLRLGFDWKSIEAGIVKGISMALAAILILLAVGALIGSWIAAGIVPTMIYYGLDLLSPKVFYLATCLICAIVSLAIGSSWTVAGTVGVSLMGVAVGMGLSPEITAGAIISGAYFGDKMSPLSDTTNLAPAVAGTDLFSHIRHMTWTTAPSLIIALAAFTVLSLGVDHGAAVENINLIQGRIADLFAPSLWLLLPVLLVLILAALKFPAFPTIMIGALVGALFALFFQPPRLMQLAGTEGVAGAVKGAWMALFSGYESHTGLEALDKLLTRGGMSSMLNTVWLILTALTFGAVMETVGMLGRIVDAILGVVHSTASLIIATIATCIGMNVIAADQYMAIVIPGRMYRLEFARRKLAEKNLSRTLEDSGTLTSVLIPWNTCGAYMAGTLGIATLSYAPYAIFNWVNPIVAIVYALLNFKIVPIEDSEPRDEATAHEVA